MNRRHREILTALQPVTDRAMLRCPSNLARAQEIPGLALRALVEGPPIGRPKPRNVEEDAALRRRGREPAFVYRVGVGGGRTINMVVVKAPNGFIVTAYPFGKKVEPL